MSRPASQKGQKTGNSLAQNSSKFLGLNKRKYKTPSMVQSMVQSINVSRMNDSQMSLAMEDQQAKNASIASQFTSPIHSPTRSPVRKVKSPIMKGSNTYNWNLSQQLIQDTVLQVLSRLDKEKKVSRENNCLSLTQLIDFIQNGNMPKLLHESQMLQAEQVMRSKRITSIMDDMTHKVARALDDAMIESQKLMKKSSHKRDFIKPDVSTPHQRNLARIKALDEQNKKGSVKQKLVLVPTKTLESTSSERISMCQESSRSKKYQEKNDEKNEAWFFENPMDAEVKPSDDATQRIAETLPDDMDKLDMQEQLDKVQERSEGVKSARAELHLAPKQTSDARIEHHFRLQSELISPKVISQSSVHNEAKSPDQIRQKPDHQDFETRDNLQQVLEQTPDDVPIMTFQNFDEMMQDREALLKQEIKLMHKRHRCRLEGVRNQAAMQIEALESALIETKIRYSRELDRVNMKLNDLTSRKQNNEWEASQADDRVAWFRKVVDDLAFKETSDAERVNYLNAIIKRVIEACGDMVEERNELIQYIEGLKRIITRKDEEKKELVQQLNILKARKSSNLQQIGKYLEVKHKSQLDKAPEKMQPETKQVKKNDGFDKSTKASKGKKSRPPSSSPEVKEQKGEKKLMPDVKKSQPAEKKKGEIKDKQNSSNTKSKSPKKELKNQKPVTIRKELRDLKANSQLEAKNRSSSDHSSSSADSEIDLNQRMDQTQTADERYMVEDVDFSRQSSSRATSKREEHKQVNKMDSLALPKSIDAEHQSNQSLKSSTLNQSQRSINNTARYSSQQKRQPSAAMSQKSIASNKGVHQDAKFRQEQKRTGSVQRPMRSSRNTSINQVAKSKEGKGRDDTHVNKHYDSHLKQVPPNQDSNVTSIIFQPDVTKKKEDRSSKPTVPQNPNKIKSPKVINKTPNNKKESLKIDVKLHQNVNQVETMEKIIDTQAQKRQDIKSADEKTESIRISSANTVRGATAEDFQSTLARPVEASGIGTAEQREESDVSNVSSRLEEDGDRDKENREALAVETEPIQFDEGQKELSNEVAKDDSPSQGQEKISANYARFLNGKRIPQQSSEERLPHFMNEDLKQVQTPVQQESEMQSKAFMKLKQEVDKKGQLCAKLEEQLKAMNMKMHQMAEREKRQRNYQLQQLQAQSEMSQTSGGMYQQQPLLVPRIDVDGVISPPGTQHSQNQQTEPMAVIRLHKEAQTVNNLNKDLEEDKADSTTLRLNEQMNSHLYQEMSETIQQLYKYIEKLQKNTYSDDQPWQMMGKRTMRSLTPMTDDKKALFSMTAEDGTVMYLPSNMSEHQKSVSPTTPSEYLQAIKKMIGQDINFLDNEYKVKNLLDSPTESKKINNLPQLQKGNIDQSMRFRRNNRANSVMCTASQRHEMGSPNKTSTLVHKSFKYGSQLHTKTTDNRRVVNVYSTLNKGKIHTPQPQMANSRNLPGFTARTMAKQIRHYNHNNKDQDHISYESDDELEQVTKGSVKIDEHNMAARNQQLFHPGQQHKKRTKASYMKVGTAMYGFPKFPTSCDKFNDPQMLTRHGSIFASEKSQERRGHDTVLNFNNMTPSLRSGRKRSEIETAVMLRKHCNTTLQSRAGYLHSQ